MSGDDPDVSPNMLEESSWLMSTIATDRRLSDIARLFP